LLCNRFHEFVSGKLAPVANCWLEFTRRHVVETATGTLWTPPLTCILFYPHNGWSIF